MHRSMKSPNQQWSTAFRTYIMQSSLGSSRKLTFRPLFNYRIVLYYKISQTPLFYSISMSIVHQRKARRRIWFIWLVRGRQSISWICAHSSSLLSVFSWILKFVERPAMFSCSIWCSPLRNRKKSFYKSSYPERQWFARFAVNFYSNLNL